jgi:hypothetical protein
MATYLSRKDGQRIYKVLYMWWSGWKYEEEVRMFSVKIRKVGILSQMVYCLQCLKKAFLSAHSWVLGTAKSGEYGVWSIVEMPFPAKKTVTLEVQNVLAHCHGEESMRDLSQLFSLVAHSINKPFQHHIICLINSSPFGYRFKVDGTPWRQKSISTMI